MGKYIRPWGYYLILSKTKQYKIKEICVLPKQRLSYQRHLKRSEHWYITKGKALVVLEDKNIFLNKEDSINIPVCSWHRIKNIGEDKLIFIEIQTGSYLEEDDIERKEDDYGRIT